MEDWWGLTHPLSRARAGSERWVRLGASGHGPFTPGRAHLWTGHSLRQAPGDHMGLTSLSWPHSIDCCDHLKHVRYPPSLLSSYFFTFQGVSSILIKRCLNGCVSIIYECEYHVMFSAILFPSPATKALASVPAMDRRNAGGTSHWCCSPAHPSPATVSLVASGAAQEATFCLFGASVAPSRLPSPGK